MILSMSKVRILGPRDRLEAVLASLQRASLLHLAAPEASASLPPLELSDRQVRERRQLRAILEDINAALARFTITPDKPVRAAAASTAQLARWARTAWLVRRQATRLDARRAALEEERALILKYQGLFAAFRPLLENEKRLPNTSVYHVLLRPGQRALIERLRTALAGIIGHAFEIYSHQLQNGEIALLIVVAAEAAPKVERVLAEAQVQDIPVPVGYGAASLGEALPRMLARLGDIPRELAALERERAELGRRHGRALLEARAGVNARLQTLDAIALSGTTTRAFVLEGWVPVEGLPRLAQRLRDEVGESIVLTQVAKEEWRSEEAPVVLRNPRLFRPFEAVISLLPLPRYGSIDPTPFVAIFFPAFFGIMLGDIGYGVVLAAMGLLLHRRSRPGSMLRSVAEIIGPCALFTIIAGALYGELFGDLGVRWFGLRPLLFSREEALVPFLLLAVGIGVVHILLGLVLGAATAARAGHRREAMGRGASVAIVILLLVALLAVVDILPRGFFTPAVIGLLAAFPLLVIAEGIVAPIELLSTLGNILSYARIMALGVASVMLAVVANRMTGAIGSAAVGIVFALLFHLVNFAIGLFSPTIHALRLHYVEFFGKFYSPGGVRYQPFGAWTREAGVTRT